MEQIRYFQCSNKWQKENISMSELFPFELCPFICRFDVVTFFTLQVELNGDIRVLRNPAGFNASTLMWRCINVMCP